MSNYAVFVGNRCPMFAKHVWLLPPVKCDLYRLDTRNVR